MARVLSVAALVVLLLVAFLRPTAAAQWHPESSLTWQIQFSGSIDLSVDVDAFDLDMFETSSPMVRRVHSSGRHVVCYINAGAWENWRPDAGDYSSAVKGKPFDG